MSRLRRALERLIAALWFEPLPARPVRLLGLLLQPLCAVTRHQATRNREAIELHKRRQDDASSARPVVVVVGNLVAGGAGKTPLTIALADALTSHRLATGIICRGDGAHHSTEQPQLVQPDSTAVTVGDEARLLARATGLPVAVCRYRARALACLTQHHRQLDVVLSDDGLQHPALARDLELAVFDQRGIGNGYLLPAGPLREPIAHLAQMDAMVINRGLQPTGTINTALPAHSNTFHSDVVVRDLIRLSDYQSSQQAHDRHLAGAAPTGAELQAITGVAAGQAIAAVAGIANPPAFFALLENAGFTINAYPLADHGDLNAKLLAGFSEPCIILTEKDAVKCQSVSDPRIFVLRIAARPAPTLVRWLVSQCRRRRPELNGSPNNEDENA